LLIDGAPVGCIESQHGFFNFISWAGLDIGRDRGSPVSHYAAPFEFTGKLIKVTVTMDDDQMLDGDGRPRNGSCRFITKSTSPVRVLVVRKRGSKHFFAGE